MKNNQINLGFVQNALPIISFGTNRLPIK